MVLMALPGRKTEGVMFDDEVLTKLLELIQDERAAVTEYGELISKYFKGSPHEDSIRRIQQDELRHQRALEFIANERLRYLNEEE